MAPPELTITEYQSRKPQDPRDFDPNWLEQTNKKELPTNLILKIFDRDSSALRDQDHDGYVEIRRSTFEEIVEETGRSHGLALAPYFRDQPTQNTVIGTLPRPLRQATQKHDFTAARNYFTAFAKGHTRPLTKVQDLLARHLSAQAMHNGLAISQPLESKTGFSVYGDGRLRFDCELFAQLAHSDLRGIRGLTFQYIALTNQKQGIPTEFGAEMMPMISSQHYHPSWTNGDDGNLIVYPNPGGLKNTPDPSEGHLLLLISDPKSGDHLLINNHEVILTNRQNLASVLDQVLERLGFIRSVNLEGGELWPILQASFLK